MNGGSISSRHLECILAVVRFENVVATGGKATRCKPQQGCFVLNQQDGFDATLGLDLFSYSLGYLITSSICGKHTLKVVPLPISLSTSRNPSLCFTMP